MRGFHKINPAIWRDEKFRAFSDDGKLAWLFMLTHPSTTALGVLPATIPGLAAELGWTTARFRKAVVPAIEQQMLEVDEAACYVGFRNWLRHNGPEGPNSVNGSWLKALDEIPECPAKRQLIARCRAYLDAKAPTWKDGDKSVKAEVWAAFSPDPSPLPSPDPSPHPSDDGSGEPSSRARVRAPQPQPQLQTQPQLVASPKPPSGASPDDPALSWLDLLNQETGSSFKPTKGNLSPIRARLAESFTLEQAITVVRAKAREWTGTEQAQFLRPQTIFGTKFDGYLQAASNGRSSGHAAEDWAGEQAGEVKATWE